MKSKNLKTDLKVHHIWNVNPVDGNEETQLNGELFVMKGVQSTGFRETLKLGFSGN